jgi:hypothetical protein
MERLKIPAISANARIVKLRPVPGNSINTNDARRIA